MKISDLSEPVVAAKADWLPGYEWIGFSPQGTGPNAKAKCESTIVRQMKGGYILERITSGFGTPNAGFENDERVVRDRRAHAEAADSLVAIHKLRHSHLPLQKIVGREEYEWLQDVWAKPNDRNRWSVAFPIIESFKIVGQPKAKDVFSPPVWDSLFHTQSATLRAMDDVARFQIAALEIEPVTAPNLWLGLAQDFAAAEGSQIPAAIIKDVNNDLTGALEGESGERKASFRKRASWVAGKFLATRIQDGKLHCDICAFDPKLNDSLSEIKARSCFDVHHRNPLAEGNRFTFVKDFALLCPTCHRIEHLLLAKTGKGMVGPD